MEARRARRVPASSAQRGGSTKNAAAPSSARAAAARSSPRSATPTGTARSAVARMRAATCAAEGAPASSPATMALASRTLTGSATKRRGTSSAPTGPTIRKPRSRYCRTAIASPCVSMPGASPMGPGKRRPKAVTAEAPDGTPWPKRRKMRRPSRVLAWSASNPSVTLRASSAGRRKRNGLKNGW